MDTHEHDMHALFSQLGLPDDDASIRRFIAQHQPLPPDVRLADAPFWSDSQAAFLKEAIRHDADWAQVVDSLSASLRETPTLQDA